MKKTLPTFKFEKKLWKKKYLVIGVDEVGRGALAGPLYVGAVCFQFDTINSESVTSLLPTHGKFVQTDPSNDHLNNNGNKVGSLKVRSKDYELARTILKKLPAVVSLSNHTICQNKEVSNLIEQLGIDDSKRLNPKQRLFFSKLIKKQALAAEIDWVSTSYINRRGIVKGTQKAMRKVINRLLNRFNRRKIFVLIDAFYIKNLRGIGLKNQLALVRGDQRSISIAAASIIAKVERDHIMYKLHQKYPVYRWDKNKGYGTRNHIEAIKRYGKSKLHRDLYLRKII